MKKYTFLFFFIVTAYLTNAQQIDKQQLYGKWRMRGCVFEDYTIDLDSIDKTINAMLKIRLSYNDAPLTANDTLAMKQTLNEMAATLEKAFVIIRTDNTVVTEDVFETEEISRDTFPLVWIDDSHIQMGKSRSDIAAILELNAYTLILGTNDTSADVPKAMIMRRYQTR